MPKKAKLKAKEEKEKIKEETSLSQEEANSLEQRIKKDENNVDFSELREFLNESDTERTSPSLKKINLLPRNPIILERDIITGNMSINNKDKEEENGFKYLPTGGNSEEAKYLKYEGMTVENISSRKEIEKLPNRPFERKEITFQNSSDARISAQENFEKYSPVKKVDKDKINREKLFERKEIKYTPEKY